MGMAIPLAGHSPAAAQGPGCALGRSALGVLAPRITPLYYATVVLRGTTSSRVLLKVQSWARSGGTDLLWATWSKDNSSTLPYGKGCCDSKTPLSWPVHRNQVMQQHNQQQGKQCDETLLKSFSQLRDSVLCR